MTNGEIFRTAAQYIREHGLLKESLGDEGGPRCVQGALYSAARIPLTSAGIHPTDEWLPNHIIRLAQARLGSTILYVWNNADERTAEDVIAFLEGLAFDEDLKAVAQSPAESQPQPVEAFVNAS
jgi:hypothetical protein